MQLWEEAARISILGTEVYAFGLYAAAGAAAAVLALCLFIRKRGLPKGTGSLASVLCILLGAFCSRLAFCLMNFELGGLMPLSGWLRITGGGWSMMGLIGGVLLGAWLTARITGQKPGVLLDAAALALPLFITLERIGERYIPEFDISRNLDSEWLANSFLAVRDEYDAYIATYRIAAACAAALFVILLIRAVRKRRRDGDLCVAFLILFGAGAIIMESLRYDLFLSISFVGLQHVTALLVLCAGVIAAAVRCRQGKTGLRRAALIMLPIAGGIGLALEFALDRSTINKFLIYAVMIAVMLTPALMGLRLTEEE